MLHNASSPGESLCGEFRHPRRRPRGKPNKDIVEVRPDHDLRLCFCPAVAVRGLEVGEECFSKLLEGLPEGHREK